MNLLSVRQQFVKLSGRYDLATTAVDDYDTDAGADFFINAGMRFLDRKYITLKTEASIFEEVASGSWYLTFQNCAAISEVWCNDDEDRWQLTKYPYKTIKENYAGLVSESDGGEPLYYSPIWLRSMDSTDFQSLGTFFNFVKTDDDGTYNGIIFTPKTDTDYNIEVVGRFYHADLSSNTDNNYWTNIAPDTLIKAALYQLNVFYSDLKASTRWLSAINVEGMDLEKNFIEQESNDVSLEE